MFHDSQKGALVRKNSVYRASLNYPDSHFLDLMEVPPIWPVLRDGTKHRFLDPDGPGRDLTSILQSS